MSRAGPTLGSLLLFLLLTLAATAPVEAKPVGFESTLVFKEVAYEQDRLVPGQDYRADGLLASVCTFAPSGNPPNDPLSMTETVRFHAASDAEGLEVEIEPKQVVIHHSPDGCFQNHHHLFDHALTYRMSEDVPAGSPMTIKVWAESDWESAVMYAFTVKAASTEGLEVTVPETIPLDAAGNGVALVHVQNDANTPLRLRFDPTVRGAIASQPHGGESVVEPGDEITREFRFHIQDDAAADVTLELVLHQSLAYEPGTVLPPIVKHIPVDLGDDTEPLSAGIEEAPGPAVALPLAALAALVAWRRRQ